MGAPRLDLSGRVYSGIEILSRNEKHPYWNCMCFCGNEFKTTHQRLKNGTTRSCGCKKSEFLIEKKTKHGGAGRGVNSPEYQSYIAMLHRCYDDKRNSWSRYGGRGIVVDEDSWLLPSPEGFLNFLKDMGQRPEGTSLDRIDSSGNYNRINCKWSNRSDQGYNKVLEKKASNTSIYRGVSKKKGRGNERKLWMARIGNPSIKQSYEYIGAFLTEKEAAIAYNKRAVEIYGDIAILNEV